MHSPKMLLTCAGLLLAAGLSSGAWADRGDHATATDDKDRHEKVTAVQHVEAHHDNNQNNQQQHGGQFGNQNNNRGQTGNNGGVHWTPAAPVTHTPVVSGDQGNHQNPHWGGQTGNQDNHQTPRWRGQTGGNGGVHWTPSAPVVQVPAVRRDNGHDGFHGGNFEHVGDHDRGHDEHGGRWRGNMDIDVHLGDDAGAHAWRHEWGEGDIRHFHDHDWDDWHGGGWRHGWYNDRFGWWWVVSGVWFYYPQPIYPYPDPYIPPDFVTPPVAEDGPAIQYWYYCAAQDGYYPYVPACPTGWTQMPAVDPTLQQSVPPPQPPPAPNPQPAQYWYYCPQSASYYPYVLTCAASWQQIPVSAPVSALPGNVAPPADAATPPPP
jgi:hypothetical protein